jgi:hypothetical protein
MKERRKRDRRFAATAWRDEGAVGAGRPEGPAVNSDRQRTCDAVVGGSVQAYVLGQRRDEVGRGRGGAVKYGQPSGRWSATCWWRRQRCLPLRWWRETHIAWALVGSDGL